MEKPGSLFAQAGTENCPRVNFSVKMQILFLKSFSFGCFFHVFTVADQLPCFSISRLATVDFLNVNIFFNCKYKCE